MRINELPRMQIIIEREKFCFHLNIFFIKYKNYKIHRIDCIRNVHCVYARKYI